MSIADARRRKRTHRKVRLPSLSFIVAKSVPDDIIGCENRLPWKLSSDLRRFRNITTNHAVVMGRKTLDSIGRRLPNRYNVILSSAEERYAEQYAYVRSVESAQFAADIYAILNGQSEYFIIGGSSVYRQFQKFIQKIYITEVYASNIVGDSYFKYKIDERVWRVVDRQYCDKSEIDEWPSRFSIYTRRDETIRVNDIIEFTTRDKDTEDFVSRMIIKYRKSEASDVRDELEQILLPFMVDE